MTSADPNAALSPVLIALMKGVTYQENDPQLWQSLLGLQARVREYVGVLGLELILDEAEGYAYLRQRPASDDASALPRLVSRRPLAFPVSLLLALLRKKLAEFDASSGDTRLILGREEIVDLVRLFMPDTANEARLADRIDIHINRIVEIGFLRPLRGRNDQLEVRRILKAFVDAQWLGELERRLADYRAHVAGGVNRKDDTP
ncbi:DUF4194 domain-containing protein [Vineibacter terrae]|uniref:DUF4194 domain-containing protein n=1 Tax=Vineibacter terrae TaxID=2586908 RepID=A0A5C8PRG6_9HYPH|nr:DUF4194 domain-containing protein [Vineibacter terrae]TXL78770.1 DUF4194 domain-containing protein [Vineibacter terrae]